MNYLYSQCEDVACRSLAPMMDTPANKFIYSAKVRAPKEYNVFMSAIKQTVTAYNETWSESIFSTPVKIPSYLIAIAVGDLEKQPISQTDTKTPLGVITEPGFMAACVKEFSGVGNLFAHVEALFPSTPYPWPQYDLLVLPPSFPMGGMENPMLTFVSPTVIVGDKSQVYVAAHEMIHSWTGNTVTHADWNNFWVTEGLTVFNERKVDKQTHDEDFMKVAAFIGNQSAYEAMENFGYWNEYSSMHPNVGDDLPDNSFSVIPYEKGFQFMYYIQSLMGEHLFGKLLDQWVAEYKFTSVKWQ